MLFTTKTCPNCKIAYTLLDKANIGYEKIDAEAQEDLTMKYGIRQAPTLIVTDGDGYESFVNLSNIKSSLSSADALINAGRSGGARLHPVFGALKKNFAIFRGKRNAAI